MSVDIDKVSSFADTVPGGRYSMSRVIDKVSSIVDEVPVCID